MFHYYSPAKKETRWWKLRSLRLGIWRRNRRGGWETQDTEFYKVYIKNHICRQVWCWWRSCRSIYRTGHTSCNCWWQV